MRIEPPALLLRATPAPVPPGEGAANLDLLLYALDLAQALAEANNDKAALRDIFIQAPPP